MTSVGQLYKIVSFPKDLVMISMNHCFKCCWYKSEIKQRGRCFYWIPCNLDLLLIMYSRTPDRDFRCFYPCEIFLSRIPVPALGKDKKLLAACRPHAGRTSIRDIIVMLKWRHHAAFQHIQDVLEVFFTFFQYKMRYLVVSEKKNPLFVWGWDRKNRPSRSTFVITWQASWCQLVILGTDFSIPPSHSWWILIIYIFIL